MALRRLLPLSVASLGAVGAWWKYSTPAHAQKGPVRAVCVLNPDGNSGVRGVVKFSQESETGPTTIEARVEGLKPGKHGFHIHQYGNLTRGCITAGPHYNPFNQQHGGPLSTQRHVGDLGNVEAGADGVAVYHNIDPLVKLSGETSVIGRSVVVHADEDDLGLGGHADSLTTGHAGARVACGVIGLDASS
eukprot:TRINITY_DN2127_c0_g1_i2.p1 TRINITY_DN2127_c0_g1~~TRINITY_DN2127_c0_g1_i2.p1  ORF type:complete len:207 (-),score=68.98 TRINITY_DN2127_c0_g1_i2:110-679(-)